MIWEMCLKRVAKFFNIEEVKKIKERKLLGL